MSLTTILIIILILMLLGALPQLGLQPYGYYPPIGIIVVIILIVLLLR